MPKRAGNNTKRRLAKPGEFSVADLERIVAESRYGGSAHHKKRWADYGFDPPANPRGQKSLCDGHRKLLKREAEELLAR